MPYRPFLALRELDARRKTGREAFKETWRYRWLPGGEFATYEALRAAVAPLTAEQIAAEKAKWPQMIEPPEPSVESQSAKCWLHTDARRTHHGWVQASWHEYDCITALICEACATAAATDPAVIVRASEARRAYCAQRTPGVQGDARDLDAYINGKDGDRHGA